MGCAVAKEDKVEFEGEVIEALPNAMFRVKLDNDHVVLGHVAGKMRRFRIRILPGDRVRCELSPYDLDRARIVYRHRCALPDPASLSSPCSYPSRPSFGARGAARGSCGEWETTRPWSARARCV